MYEIVVHEDADSELNNAAAFFQSRQEGLGDQFLGEVAAAFRRIQSHPFSGSTVFDEFHRHLMRRFPYSIVYRVETEKVFVLAVAHLRRRPLYWRDRT